jgi:hypothetical protein
LIVRDRSGATTDHVLPDLQAPTFAAHLAPVVAKDAVLVSDGRDAYGAFAHAANILHIPIIASRGERSYKGFHIQNVNAYAGRLKDWLRPFKGVVARDNQDETAYCLTQLCSRGFFSDLFVKCRDAAHRTVVHSGMAAQRRRAQTPSRLAGALTSRLAAVVARPHLDGGEHDAMLGPAGWNLDFRDRARRVALWSVDCMIW